MNAELIREYALAKVGVDESLPFGPDTLVFKVKGKVFLLLALDAEPFRFNVKCDPERALGLREEYPEIVLPGYHMNKKHWNTVICAGMKSTMLKEMIDDSYRLVSGNKK